VLDRRLPEDLSFDSPLRAREVVTQARLGYIVAQSEYNTALAEVHYRSAQTLLANSVTLHPGPQVYGKARHRDAVRATHSFTAWKWVFV
jgi:hypothetical protein